MVNRDYSNRNTSNSQISIPLPKLNSIAMAARTDLFQSPDYFAVDELLTEEHLMIRDAVRSYVKKKFHPSLKTMHRKPSSRSI